MGLYGIALVIGFAAAIFQICIDPRITRRYLTKASLAFALYMAYCGAAIVGLTLLIQYAQGPHAVQSLSAAFMGWTGLGVLGLIRFAPRLRGQAPPRFLERVGVVDAACLIALVAGVATALGEF